MSDFKDQLNEAARALASQPPRVKGHFDGVLEEFASFLNGLSDHLVGAAVEDGPRPEQRALVTWPRYLRSSRSVMLTFWFTGKSIEVEGFQKKKFTRPAQLEAYLVDFLKNSSFQDTLIEYDERCGEEAVGLLRVEDRPEEDVFALVPSASQEKIATEALAGHTGTLVVKVRTHPGPGQGSFGGQIGRPVYEPSKRYSVLASNGFDFMIDKHEADGTGEVTLTGRAKPV